MSLGNSLDKAFQQTLPSTDFEPTTREKCAKWLLAKLEAAKWTREIAGEQDWNALIKGFCDAMCRKRYGMIISGNCGCGKTSFVDATGVCNDTIHCLLPEEVRWLNFDDNRDYVNELMQRNVLIDDFGAQPLFNDYGTPRDYVSEFLCRYELYGKGRVFCITNLRGKQLQEKVGDVVISRLKNLCVPVLLIGADKRKWII